VIALVRHGRSGHVHRGWIDRRQFDSWRQAYEAAGIRSDERVPLELAELVAEATLVVTSDAPRAVESARLLWPGREVVASPLLRELELRPPELGRLRLPLAGWALAVGVRRGRPTPADLSRVEEAASWLSSLAEREPFVVAVTHGWMRRELARSLLHAGWRARDRRRPVHPWSVWLLLRGRLGSCEARERSSSSRS
jgi:broad specificity phosphatase PhoE